MILETAIMCLAMNTYMEARGEPLEGQHAVAQVTMNRAHGDPGKVCEVVEKPKQFSWTNKSFGLISRKNGDFALTAKGMPKDKKAWATAFYIAKFTLNGVMPDVIKGATFYHASSVAPGWNRKMTMTVAYGNHLFYRYNS